MTAVASARVFGTDYTDKRAVIDLAEALGKGQVVFRDAGRNNYGITHAERGNLPGRTVVYSTDWDRLTKSIARAL